MRSIESLLELLNLEQIESNLFRGKSYPTAWGRVFGGQVLGQSLNAAYQTIPEERVVHSMHAYFILGGNLELPIEYSVEKLRDTGSFSTRRVKASQEGKAIFTMSASFQVKQEFVNHQAEMPKVPSPDDLKFDFELIEELKEKNPYLYKRLIAIHPNALQFKPVEAHFYSHEKSVEPIRNIWFKAHKEFKGNLAIHQQLLALASDYHLLSAAALPHLEKVNRSKLTFTSLDHALYFHRAFKLDDWLLYSIDSPSASNSRGLCRGQIFNQDGLLVASVVQQGLIRSRSL